MSKYDCNNIMDYGHEFRRLCDSYPSCSDNGRCPLIGRYCNSLGRITQEEIDILQKWSDENPEAPKIRKRELDFITMFKWCEDKRVERGTQGYLFLAFDEKNKYSLCNSWFSFIGKGESMTFEELLKLEVEE